MNIRLALGVALVAVSLVPAAQADQASDRKAAQLATYQHARDDQARNLVQLSRLGLVSRTKLAEYWHAFARDLSPDARALLDQEINRRRNLNGYH